MVCEREIGGQEADAEHASFGEAQGFGLGRGGVFANQRIAARATGGPGAVLIGRDHAEDGVADREPHDRKPEPNHDPGDIEAEDDRRLSPNEVEVGELVIERIE